MIKSRTAVISTLRSIPVLLSLLLQATPAPAGAASELTVHELDAPAFSLRDLKGSTRTLAEFRGQVVLVNFWASWCPPCIHEMPALERLGADLADAPFTIIAINSGEQKYRVWKFARLIDLDLPVLLDSDRQVFDDWQVSTLPTSFLLDGNGQVRYRAQGVPDWNSEETMAIIRQMLQEEKTQ